MTDFTITQEQRRELLESHNELRSALQTIWECQDLWMSDVTNIERLVSRMQRHLGFAQPTEGHAYMNYVLAEDNKPAPKKRGRPAKGAKNDKAQ